MTLTRAISLFMLALLLNAQPTPSAVKDQKLAEINQRIKTLQAEIDGLTALRNTISSGQLPDAAIALINVSPAIPAPQPVVSTVTPAPVIVPNTPARAVVSAPSPAPASSVYHQGPRGGCYKITASGNKSYVDRSMCR